MTCKVSKFSRVTYTLIQHIWNMYFVWMLWLLFSTAAPFATEVRLTVQCCWKGSLFQEDNRRAEGRENCF